MKDISHFYFVAFAFIHLMKDISTPISWLKSFIQLMKDITHYYFVAFCPSSTPMKDISHYLFLAFCPSSLEVARLFANHFQGGDEKMQKASGEKRIVFLHLPTLGFRYSHSFLLWISLTMAPINCHSVLYSMYQNIAL